VALTTSGRRAAWRSARAATLEPSSKLLLRSAGSLVATFAVTSALGAAFWLVAARYWSKDAIGFAAGAVSAMLLLGQLSTLGLGTLLTGELPRRATGRVTLVTSAMLVSACIGAVAGLAFALTAPAVSSHYHPLVSSGWCGLAFVTGVGLMAASLVFDGATIGIFRGGLQLWRNAFFAVARIGVLALFAIAASRGSATILWSWAAGLASSLALVLAVTRPRGAVFADYRPRLGMLTGFWMDAIRHQALNVSFNTPLLLLPIIVLAVASAAANATFYIALQIAAVLYVAPVALTTALFAVGRLEPASLARRVRLTLAVSAGVTCLGLLILLGSRSALLRVFGSTYADAGPTLALLAFAAIPMVVKAHFLAITRIEQLMSRRLPLIWSTACVEIAAGAAGAAIAGAKGAAVGWLLALCAEALAMSPVVWRAALDARP
jgi:O-antigen/teichoic acid export membrane protein